MTGYEHYLTSPTKGSIKFWLNFVNDGVYGLSYPSASVPWKYLDSGAWATYLATAVSDPQYLKINGKPVVGIFGTPSTGPAIDVTHRDELLANVGGINAVYLVETDGSSTIATTLGANALFKYGIQNLIGGTGHQGWGVSETADINNSVPSGGRDRISQVNAVNDARALDTTAGTRTWVDNPPPKRWYKFLRTQLLGQPTAKMAITIWNESAEEGPGILPTAQEGTRFLDQIDWLVHGWTPSLYTEPLDANSVACDTSGTWTYNDPFAGGGTQHSLAQGSVYAGDTIQSGNTGDFKGFTETSLRSATVTAITGPDRGKLDCYVDGSVVQTADTYSASYAIAQVCSLTFTADNLSHSFKAQVRGDKNASSSAVTIELDKFDVTYAP